MSLGVSGWKSEAEVLDLAAAGPELPLAAAVDRDPVRVAVLVDGEQLAQRAEPRRLELIAFGGHSQRLDVGDRVDRRVPGDAVGERLEQRPGLVVDVGVLELGVGEGLGDLPVELGVGLDVDRGAAVVALEVEDVDGASSPSSAISSGVQSFSGSSLKRRPGYLSSRLRIGSMVEPASPSKRRQPRRADEADAAAARGRAPRAAATPAWRSARSSAALSKAQRR